MSFNPLISHYRHKHAPRRLYLPPELSVRIMHDDFKPLYPNINVHYTTYLRGLRISFAKLGEEECEMCIEHDHHQLRDKTRYNVLKDLKHPSPTPVLLQSYLIFYFFHIIIVKYSISLLFIINF